MPKVTVTIITYNEEANIGEALESVRWADEVVVLDSFSSDLTVEIARGRGARVHQQRWAGYSDQKNAALDLASHEWVLSLDADERVTPELAREIQDLLRSEPPCDGYWVARKNHFLGRWIRHGGWFPDYSVRLFRRSKGRFGARAVHEAVAVDGATDRLRNPLLHFTYRSLDAYLLRMDRYSTLAAGEMVRERRSVALYDFFLRPVWTFVKMYFVRQGFREGREGLVLAGLYAFYAFSKYAKLWERRLSRDSKARDPFGQYQ